MKIRNGASRASSKASASAEQGQAKELAEPPVKKFKQLKKNVTLTLKMAWDASKWGLILNGTFALAISVVPPLTTYAGAILVNKAVGEGITARTLIIPIAALVILTAASRILGVAQRTREFIFAQKVGLHAEKRFVEHAAAVDLGHFDNSDWHDRVKRAREGINYRPRNLISTLLGLGGYAVTVVSMIGLLATVGWELVILAVLSVVPTLTVQRKVTKLLYNFYYGRTQDQRERHYLSTLLSEPEHSKEVRAFTLRSYLVDRYYTKAMDLHNEETRLQKRAERAQILSGLVSSALLALAYVFVGLKILEGQLNPGDLLIIMGSMTQIASYVGGISSSLVQIEENARFLDDYFSFLEVEPLVQVNQPAIPFREKLVGGIEFDDVTFTYPRSNEPALKGLSLHIKEGELMALVGDNGAGKTSMIKLLMRFYDPDSGSIRVGGVDLREADPEELRSRIGILFQDFGKYMLSARDNVGFGRVERDPTDDSVNEAMEAARAQWLVKKLSGGLDSKVGRLFEGGQDLSGGEWQRLALARLMYRDADIWILDEPTSALDPEAEAGIFSELRESLQGRIGIVISHRFSTVRIADRIAVVHDGRISELGTHEELLDLSGRYAQLFELQAAGYR